MLCDTSTGLPFKPMELIDEQGVHNEHLNIRFFTITLKGDKLIIDHSNLAADWLGTINKLSRKDIKK